MKIFNRTLHLMALIILLNTSVWADQYYTLCEGNFGQANASVWSIDKDLTAIEGPLTWNGNNYWGDVGQSLTLSGNRMYAIMNNSHEIQCLDLSVEPPQMVSLNLQGAGPRYMAVHEPSGLAYVSCWNLAGLLIIDLDNMSVVDTLSLGKLPEQILIQDDKLYVSISMLSDWSAENEVLQIDLSGNTPLVTNTYEVLDGPGAMVLDGNNLYVTSIYYSDAWETYSGTSHIDLNDGSVVRVEHGLYPNFTADIRMINDTPYRTFGTSIVPLNADMTLNTDAALGDVPDIYTFSVLNEQIVIGSSDFVAPDQVHFLTLAGNSLATFQVGALPSDFVYYSTDPVGVNESRESPTSFSLSNNFPNPFNPSTSIPFEISASSLVSLKIFDLRGRMVVSLVDQSMSSGSYEQMWDGRNLQGHAVSSGIYYAVLRAGNFEQAIKMNLLR